LGFLEKFPLKNTNFKTLSRPKKQKTKTLFGLHVVIRGLVCHPCPVAVLTSGKQGGSHMRVNLISLLKTVGSSDLTVFIYKIRGD
jgi:hypothetical protein